MSADIVPFNIEQQTDGDLRISDAELANRLGYPDLRVFRRLIKKHRENLDQLGDVFSKRTVPAGGGKTTTAYLLTEHQALFMVSRSDMPVATQIMISVSRAFIEMRRAGNQTPLNAIAAKMGLTRNAIEKYLRDERLATITVWKRISRYVEKDCAHEHASGVLPGYP